MTEHVTPSRTDVVTEPKQPDKSLGQLFGELGSDLGSLVRQELDLAKVETRQELRKALQAVVSFAAAGVAGLLALIMVSEAAAWLLDQWLNTALSFLIVGLVWAVIAAVAVAAGRRRMRTLAPIPQTVETVKDDVEWAKQQTS